MAFPVSGDKSGSECAGWVHAGSGVWDCSEMSQSDCQSDSQGSNEARVGLIFISYAEYDEYEYEAEEEFKAETLELVNEGVQWSVTETNRTFSRNISDESLQRSNARSGSDALGNDVEEGADNWDLSSCQKTDSNCRVDMTSGNMADCLSGENKFIKDLHKMDTEIAGNLFL